MDAASAYQGRLAARLRDHHRLAELDARISYGRLAVVALTILTAFLAFRFALFTPWWLLAPAVAFLAMAVWHDRVLRAKTARAMACEFYRHRLARIDDRWIGTGNDGSRFIDEPHLYANDLDLFGRGSLFELLSLARTRIGEQTLAAWLKAPAEVDAVERRQQAVAELRDQLDFREVMATAGTAGELDTDALGAWIAETPPEIPSWVRMTGVLLSIVAIATIWWWASDGPIGPMVLALLAKAAFTKAFHARVSRALAGVESSIHQLDILSDALTHIEQLDLQSPRLVALRSDMMATGVLPSRAITRLGRLAEMLDWQRNTFFAPIGALLSWQMHIAAFTAAWRREYGPRVAVWLNTVGEYEALNSFAAYAYEHPADPFPTFLHDVPAAAFEGIQIGHPLVAAAQMVRNDVRLGGDVRMLIISGSNMSGKSTLLRTVGVNVVMAMAGAPVRADRLTLTPLAVGATLHIQDSLQAGRSRFFTEITRVRQIADLAERSPALLFLLDELFQGTNSNDRKAGATAVLKNLLDRGAIGLITTHDLALTAMAADLENRAENVHFRDDFTDGEMVFDYHMRPGPVTHSNALHLMRAVGLTVANGEAATDKRRV